MKILNVKPEIRNKLATLVFQCSMRNLFGIWNPEFGTCLEFRIWNLEFSLSRGCS